MRLLVIILAAIAILLAPSSGAEAAGPPCGGASSEPPAGFGFQVYRAPAGQTIEGLCLFYDHFGFTGNVTFANSDGYKLGGCYYLGGVGRQVATLVRMSGAPNCPQITLVVTVTKATPVAPAPAPPAPPIQLCQGCGLWRGR